MTDSKHGLSIGEVKIHDKMLNIIRGNGPSCSGCYFEDKGSPSWCCANGVNCVVDNELIIFVEAQK